MSSDVMSVLVGSSKHSLVYSLIAFVAHDANIISTRRPYSVSLFLEICSLYQFCLGIESIFIRCFECLLYLQHMNDASVNNDIQNAAHNSSFIVSGFVDLLCVHYHWKDSFSIHEKCTATIITTSFTQPNDFYDNVLWMMDESWAIIFDSAFTPCKDSLVDGY